MAWARGLVGALRRALSKEAKQHVGTDRFGNNYYSVPEYKNWRGEATASAAAAASGKKREGRARREPTRGATAVTSPGGGAGGERTSCAAAGPGAAATRPRSAPSAPRVRGRREDAASALVLGIGRHRQGPPGGALLWGTAEAVSGLGSASAWLFLGV